MRASGGAGDADRVKAIRWAACWFSFGIVMLVLGSWRAKLHELVTEAGVVAALAFVLHYPATLHLQSTRVVLRGGVQALVVGLVGAGIWHLSLDLVGRQDSAAGVFLAFFAGSIVAVAGIAITGMWVALAITSTALHLLGDRARAVARYAPLAVLAALLARAALAT